MLGENKLLSHTFLLTKNMTFNISTFSKNQYIFYRFICESISKRAAYLVASGISALLNKIGEKVVTVGIDGSVYKYHPHFHNILVEKINHLVDPGIQFELKQSEDGNGMGAALVAAVAEQYNIM